MIEAQERKFATFDGTELFYRAWLPQGKATRALFILHRGHEHSGRVQELVEKLDLKDFAVFAWDQRGHGNSPGTRGFAPHFFDLMRDLDAFVRQVRKEYALEEENIALLGHSVAAVVAALWVQNYAPRIRALVLGTPAFRVKLYVPFALPALRFYLWICEKLGRSTPFIKSYVKGKLLTHDIKEATAYDTDTLVSKQIAVNILTGLFDASNRLLNDAGAITTPTLLLSARTDWVVKNRPQRDFFKALSSKFKRVHVYKGFYHSIFHEKERAQPIAAVRDFIIEAFKYPLDRSELLKADRDGYTYEEYQWLAAGLPPISFKRLGFLGQRLAMRTLGSLSKGIKLGWRTGFDSGQSLDYVYNNKAQGATKLGEMIDRSYLDSIGWRGIRQRKLNLESTLKRAISELLEQRGSSHPIRIVDLAGGPARYVLDTIKELNNIKFEVLIRDWSEEGLSQGRKIAEELKLSHVRYERGDAFDPESVGKINAGVDIAIVSGLYELFPDNTKLKTSLAALNKIVSANGYLIYTNQPWHPQLEMIAEVLVNRDQKPWIMRRRTQAEMDELVREAGFQKTAMQIDNFGIFTVSSAKKV